jgi:acetyl-CoA carboxylase biotin carboxyl carrier protein
MSSVPFDPEAIRMLAAILTETGLTEIEIAGKDSRIKVVRAAAGVAAVAVSAAATPIAKVESPAVAADDAQHPGAVLSPMVGVVYLAPEPGAAQFVLPGQVVAAGQTLLLIEAMKTFNQIKAPRAGTVARILVPAGAPVEYGEPLVILEP